MLGAWGETTATLVALFGPPLFVLLVPPQFDCWLLVLLLASVLAVAAEALLRCLTHGTAMQKVASRHVIGFGTGQQKNGPCMMDKSQTPTSYAQLPVRGTIVSREIGGRRETAP